MAEAVAAAHAQPRDRDPWPYKAGKKGINRVRAYTGPGGYCYVEWYETTKDPQTGLPATKRVQDNLYHTDRRLARLAAEAKAGELAAKAAERLLAGEQPEPEPDGELTLKQMFKAYLAVKLEGKSRGQQTFERTTVGLALGCWPSDTVVASMTRHDWQDYIDRRKAGELVPPGYFDPRYNPEGKRRPVAPRPRTINRELSFIRSVCTWAAAEVPRKKNEKDNPKPLLSRNPFVGCKLVEKDSRDIPYLEPSEMALLLRTAKRLNAPSWFELLIHLADGTGHRLSSILGLVWRDVEGLARRGRDAEIHWRAGLDKIGLDHRVPIHPAVVQRLREAWRAAGKPGPDVHIFPSRANPGRPISASRAGKVFRQVRDAAGLDKRRLGWHFGRRKANTELKHLPATDRAAILGYRDPMTPIRIYDRPDLETMRAGVLQRRVVHSVVEPTTNRKGRKR